MENCPNCGGDLIGDGYTQVLHCENVDDDIIWSIEPDAFPIFCGLNQENQEKDEKNELFK